jgi:hypothetical protein
MTATDPQAPAGASRPGRLRASLDRFFSSEEQRDAADLRSKVAADGATAVSTCCDRQLVTVSGTLRSVVLTPRDGAPALEAELFDGTGVVVLVWLGRRRIPGLDCGRSLTAHGRVLVHDGRRVIYNPRYELRPMTAA